MVDENNILDLEEGSGDDTGIDVAAFMGNRD